MTLFFRGLRAASWTAAAAVALAGGGAAASGPAIAAAGAAISATPIEVEAFRTTWTNDVGAFSVAPQLERWPSLDSLLGVELRLTGGTVAAEFCSENPTAIDGCIGVGLAAWGFGLLSSDDGPLAACGDLDGVDCVELEAVDVQRSTSLLPREWFAGDGLAGVSLAAWYSWPVFDAAGEYVYPVLVDVHEAGGTLTVVYIVEPDLDGSGLVDFGDLTAALGDWGGLCSFDFLVELLARWGDA
jgi:hypothetical protein